MKKGIAVAGSILVDIINTVSKFPNEGELTQISSVSRAVGGCVSNVAVDIKKISNTIDVRAIGKIGNDDYGKYVMHVLNANGVNTDMITGVDGGITSFTQVISVDGGQRTFFTYSGASAEFGMDDINFSALNADIIHLGYFLLLERVDGGDGIKILEKAQKAGIKTSIDLVSENSNRYKTVIPCLKYTDYLIINELEGGRLTNIEPSMENISLIAERLLKSGVNEKVIIHFADGSVCMSKDGKLTSLGSYELPDNYIKGTTGAGDAFCAGALIGIYNKLSDREILEYATACAAMALGAQDATSGLTDIKTAFEKTKALKRKKLCL